MKSKDFSTFFPIRVSKFEYSNVLVAKECIIVVDIHSNKGIIIELW